MSNKHLVCQGAILTCKYGTTPDKLKVNTQTKHYINEKNPKEKLTATHMDIGQTLEQNSFGLCKLQPLPGGGYKPCQAVITQWSGFYEKVTLKQNNGHPLLEDSKATCPIGGPDCISIIDHGQIAQPTQQNIENADEEALTELMPFISTKKSKNKYIPINK